MSHRRVSFARSCADHVGPTPRVRGAARRGLRSGQFAVGSWGARWWLVGFLRVAGVVGAGNCVLACGAAH
eukprot:4910730-Prymnesium_polylepis.1